MKRELSSENDQQGGKRRRNNENMVRFLIPSRIAGGVIGKGGQHIQKMRSEYKATVSVDDCQGPERTILISADMDSTMNVIKEMLNYFEEENDALDVRMLIHQSLAGCIIGKGGAKIKEVRDKVGCQILKVFPRVAPQSTDRVVQVVGKKDTCVEAIREILDAAKEVPIKGSIMNYDPFNFDDFTAEEYGGYGGGRGGGRGGRGGRGGGGEGRSGRSFGRGGRDDDIRGRSADRRDRDFINPWASDGPIGGGGGGGFGSMGSGSGFGSGGGGGFGGGFGGRGGPDFGSDGPRNFSSGPGNFEIFGDRGGLNGGNMMNGSNRDMGPGSMSSGGFGMNNGAAGSNDGANSTQVTIPTEYAGAIIGKGGERIRRIRNNSGAQITIDKPAAGSNDRIITISGTQKQIQMAQYLLQQSVRESRNRF